MMLHPNSSSIPLWNSEGDLQRAPFGQQHFNETKVESEICLGAKAISFGISSAFSSNHSKPCNGEMYPISHLSNGSMWNVTENAIFVPYTVYSIWWYTLVASPRFGKVSWMTSVRRNVEKWNSQKSEKRQILTRVKSEVRPQSAHICKNNSVRRALHDASLRRCVFIFNGGHISRVCYLFTSCLVWNSHLSTDCFPDPTLEKSCES